MYLYIKTVTSDSSEKNDADGADSCISHVVFELGL